MPTPAMAQPGRLRLLAVLAVGSALGCADPWDEYESSLYEALRVPGPATHGRHVEVLRQFVERYEEEGKKPPPGILAECGFYLARLGRAEEAGKYFKAEKVAYPESAAFVTALERTIGGHRAFQPDADKETPGGDSR